MASSHLRLQVAVCLSRHPQEHELSVLLPISPQTPLRSHLLARLNRYTTENLQRTSPGLCLDQCQNLPISSHPSQTLPRANNHQGTWILAFRNGL